MNSESGGLENFEELLEQFSTLSADTRRDQTVLEITGYPRYENVCSNILAFYFDPSREHNLGSLLLKCLLDETFPEYSPEALDVESVRREEATESGNRLDIVIEASGAVVGIENKIDAPLYNDLPDYLKHLSDLAKERQVYPVVLSLAEITNVDLHGFASITHERFLRSVQESLGPHLLEGRGRYLEFLLEFIETMQGMTRRPTVDKELWGFFEERENEIMALNRQMQGFQKELRSMVQRLAECLDFPKDVPDGTVRQWFWREQGKRLLDDCVIDIRMDDDLMIALDTSIEPTGWSTCVWARHGSVSGLNEHLDAIGLDRESHPDHRDRFIVTGSKLSADTPVEKVAERLQPIVDSLLSRAV